MGSLDGMRVLDMTQYEAGTSCTQMLAWLGADVVKIESPTGDPGRGVGRQLPGESDDERQYFMNYNANKRSVVINLKSDEGRQVLLDMAPKYDVFVENYGPGVVEKLGIGYDVLSKINPGIIHARIKGFGLTGPYSEFNCYDWVAQASAGTFSVTGEPDGPPMHPARTMSDSGTGIQMALAITAAYVEQQRTGQGQEIEISMQEATTMFMRTLGLDKWGTDAAPRTGIHHGGGVTATYPCKPEDGEGDSNDWAFIMVVTSQMWDSLCAAIGKPELSIDPRYEDPTARMENKAELYEVVASWTREHTKREVMNILGPAGVPVSYVFSSLDLFTDPHLVSRDFIQTVEHPINGEVKLMRNPIRMRGVEALQHSPLLDAHTNEVVTADLGLDPSGLGELREAGAIGSPFVHELAETAAGDD
jgi:crotonobetainyl-CoA:carnitine CoA-transferase CaiB-like acyl-CoA transferase